MSSVSTLTLPLQRRPDAPQPESSEASSSLTVPEAAVVATVDPEPAKDEGVVYASILVSSDPKEVELPVEAEYVTVSTVPTEFPAAAGDQDPLELQSDENESLGESVILNDGLLNTLSQDWTEDDVNTSVALCSNRPLTLVNHAFVVESRPQEGEEEEAAAPEADPSNGATINIDMDTTTSVI